MNIFTDQEIKWKNIDIDWLQMEKGVNEFFKNMNEKAYCIEYNKYAKLKNPKISYIFNETLVLPIICSKCGDNNDIILTEK